MRSLRGSRRGFLGVIYLHIRLLHMRVVVAALMATLFAAAASAGQPEPAAEAGHGAVLIEVRGLQGSEGAVRAALWRVATGFPSEAEEAWRQTTAVVERATCRLEFKDVPYGRYAVSLYHDENGNEEFDRNFLGIPTEGFGASNNRASRFRTPVFEDAVFRLEQPTKVLSIHVRHF